MTIVVLLILAGITIVYVFGDNGVFKQAQDAKDKTDRAKLDEQDYFNNIGNDINDYVSGNIKRVLIEDIIGKKQDKNTPAKDSLGNPITIPAGFKVVPDEENGVTYTYTGDKKPAVQDGIVIEDEEGNQFVWIPVGEIKNKSGDSNGPSTTIQLARYTFDIKVATNSTTLMPEITGGTGAIKTTKTDGTSLSEEREDIAGDEWGYLEEVSTSNEYGNTKAKDIEGFKTKAKSEGGYYLARYEASYKDATHCYSKVSTGTLRTSSSTAIASGMLWNYITQPNAATVARNSFSNSYVESDLVNSYAWDTAIVFIQTYSGDTDYSIEVGPSFSSSFVNTGTNGDKRCNIYDMASNTMEWTTETAPAEYLYCVHRGGVHFSDGFCTAIRNFNGIVRSGLRFLSSNSLCKVELENGSY